jgi:integrase
VVELGRQGGKRLRKYLYGPSKAAVRKQIKELREQRSSGVPVVPRRETLGAFLDRWYATLKPRPQGKFSPTTLKGYADAIRIHLQPRLGHVRVGDLNAEHIQELQDGMLAQGYASQTVLNVRNILRGAMRHAMRQRLLAYNPIELVEAPPGSHGFGQAIEPEGAGSFLAAIRGHRWEAAFLMELALGCRRSEVLGLEWAAVDLRPGQERIHIRQGLHRVKGHGIVVLGPKSLRGNRTLALPRRVAALLRQRQEDQAREQVLACERWQNTRPDGTERLVFTTTRGTSIEPSRYSNSLKASLREAGIGHLRGHDLRHSASSILQALGLPPQATMDLLGHASPAVTMGIYGHLLSSSRRQAAVLMDQYLDEVEPASKLHEQTMRMTR